MKSLTENRLGTSTIFSLFFTGIVLTCVPISNTIQSYNINDSSYEYIMNKNDYIDNNLNMTTNCFNNDFFLNEKIKELKSCINNEALDFGEDEDSLKYYMSIRNDSYYEIILSNVISEGLKYKIALLNILSQIDYPSIYNIEKQFVLNSMLESNLTIQEYALNAISQWNDLEMIKEISHIKVKNIFLQDRLDKIVKRILIK